MGRGSRKARKSFVNYTNYTKQYKILRLHVSTGAGRTPSPAFATVPAEPGWVCGWLGGDCETSVVFPRGGRRHAQVLVVLRALSGGKGRAFAAVAAPPAPVGATFAFFLVLDPSVLEPDLHLLLGEVQVGGDLDSPQSGEVHVGGELPLQLQELRAGECGAHPLATGQLAGRAVWKWRGAHRQDRPDPPPPAPQRRALAGPR